jgi:AraC family transcriptional regulator
MWEERAWARHPDRKMIFRVRSTSAGRNWGDFEAEMYDATGGFSEVTPKTHLISMQVGRPLLVTSGCDGAIERHLQSPGDLKIIPAGASRIWETESATVKLSMFVSPSLVRTAAEAMEIEGDRVSIAPQLHMRDPRIEHIGWAIKAELEAAQPFGRVYAESLGLALATQLVRGYAQRVTHRPVSLSSRRIARVNDYIRANISSDLSLFELAKVAGVSASHFKTLFKERAGMPVHQYVMRTRVNVAVELLQRDAAPLVDVALQAGFANPSHMARCMRRFIGVTPGRLRESQ